MTRGAVARALAAVKRALYRGDRPRGPMRLLQGLDRSAYGRWFAPRNAAVLRVRGRTTGREHTVPVAIASVRGDEYLVSMLGSRASWVRNARAAGGAAVLRRRGRDTAVALEEVPVGDRAAILRRYVAIAPGARPHLGLGPEAPLDAFERIAAAHPVFRIRRIDRREPNGSAIS